MGVKDDYLKMDGASRFLLEHCEKTLREIRKAYGGISHSVNRCNAEYAERFAAEEELRKTVETQAEALREAQAAIRELQEWKERLTARLLERFGKKDSNGGSHETA